MGNVGGGAAASKRLCLEDDSTAFTVGDSLKEIMDLEEFKRALSTAREAMSYALPWNKSISHQRIHAGLQFLQQRPQQQAEQGGAANDFHELCLYQECPKLDQ
jgi:hypothetical protein